MEFQTLSLFALKTNVHQNAFSNRKFENVSVNIYETGSFTKFNKRGPEAKFFNNIPK